MIEAYPSRYPPLLPTLHLSVTLEHTWATVNARAGLAVFSVGVLVIAGRAEKVGGTTTVTRAVALAVPVESSVAVAVSV